MAEIVHKKSHAVTSTTDHTSSATADQVLKADANGLPVDGAATDTQLGTLVGGSQSNADSLHAHGCLSLLTKGGEDGIGVGKVVYFSGQSGNDPVIKLAKADSALTMPAGGITVESGDTDDDIWIRTKGILNSTNTVGEAVGDAIYVSAATAGEWTTTKPLVATSLIQKIGTIIDVGVSGNIEVSGAGRVNDIPNMAEKNVWVGDANGVPQATDTPIVTNLTFDDANGDPFTTMDLATHQLDAFNELATTEFDTTAATAGSVRTITITQPESEKHEFIINEKRLEQPTQTTMTKVHTGLNGTDAAPNRVYTYIQNDGGDEPELTASNVDPNGAVNHVDCVYEVVGAISASSSNIYATNNVKAYIHETIEKMLDRFKEQGSLYKSGMDITADADSFAITSGTGTHVLATAAIPALEVDRVTPVDDQFTIEDDSTYTTYDDFQIDEYYDGVAVVNTHHVKCRIGVVINNPELTSARIHIIPQRGASIYITAAQGWADVSGMAQTTPRDSVVKFAFIPVADIVIKNTTGTFTLIAHPDTGLYYNDVRGQAAEGGGGGGSASQNLYESFTGDSGSSTASSSTDSMAMVGGTGITTTVTDDQVSIAGDAASVTAAGIQENATTAEINAATALRTITPDAFKTSIHGTKTIIIRAIDDITSLVTGDGIAKFVIPEDCNGMNLVDAQAHVFTASTSGLPSIQIHNLTQAADMLSTNITIDANEKDSSTATTPPVIDTANDDVATADEIRIDVDVAGTGTKGLEVRLKFQTP